MPGPREVGRRYWGAIPVALIAAILALRACVAVDPLDQLAIAERVAADPPGEIARTGSIDVRRGGPVVIGFQADGPARLEVGDPHAARHVGGGVVPSPGPDCSDISHGHVCRIMLDRGATAVRFVGPASSRLVWSPVGRRGDPEYVPASSLSAEPPERAEFGACAGANPFDGACALAILAIVVATSCALARRRLALVPRAAWIGMAAVFATACLVRWIDLSGFGETWDEGVYWASGRNYVTNLLALDFHARSWAWNFEHPPVMKYLAGIGAQLADGYGPARALSAVWTAIGCALLVPIGARLYRLRVGVLAGVIAALLPPLIAHGQIVGHESPSVLWWTLGIALALGVNDGEPDRRTLLVRLAWVGVVVGVAIDSRYINGLLGPLCGLIVVATAPAPRRRQVARLGAGAMTLAAIVTIYALWPRLWLHPISALVESFHKLSAVHSAEPFLGGTTNHPPPYYFVVYLFATLPAGVLLGVVAWAARFRRTALASSIVLAWLVIPLLVAISPVRQDGVRYVMPSVVALALAGAVGWDAIATWLEPRFARAFATVAIVVVGYLACVDVRIHPYYLDYFAEQVGGPSTVADHAWFETAWWGEGLDRAIAYVNDHAEPGAAVYRDCIEPKHLGWFRQDLWPALARSPARAAWIVSYAPLELKCPIPSTARLVFEVDVAGAPLARVYANSSRSRH